MGVPARDEEGSIAACLQRLLSLPADPRAALVEVVVLANNCTDRTARIAEGFGPRCGVLAVDLPPDLAHAGWARRLALDAAADRLESGGDVLMSTDADTIVAEDWLSRTLDHLDAGWDAVAGLARLDPRELRGFNREHRRRLALVQRHENALTRLRAADGAEPWPRHFYEGGASIALTLDAYRRTGGAPTPPVGEDKALFDAVRGSGGRVRHATDVRVTTSARLVGRAPGGGRATPCRRGARRVSMTPSTASPPSAGGPLSFAGLGAETRRARRLVAQVRIANDATGRDDRPRRAG